MSTPSDEADITRRLTEEAAETETAGQREPAVERAEGAVPPTDTPPGE